MATKRDLLCTFLYASASESGRDSYHKHYFLKKGKKIYPIEESSIEEKESPKFISEEIFQQKLNLNFLEWDGVLSITKDSDDGLLEFYPFWFDEKTLDFY